MVNMIEEEFIRKKIKRGETGFEINLSIVDGRLKTVLKVDK